MARLAVFGPNAARLHEEILPVTAVWAQGRSDRATLRPLGESYRGALPRMVLLCLEAWHRRDYATFLAERVLPASHRFEWAVK